MSQSKRNYIAGFFVVNLIPLSGVVAFDWTLGAVAVFYWFEAGIAVLFSALEGLFAAKPIAGELYLHPFRELRSKRGGVRLCSRLPPIYPRNVPLVIVILEGFAIVWPAAGFGLYVLGVDTSLTGATVTVLVSSLVVVLVQALTFVSYLHTGRYTAESARSVIDPGRVFGLIAVVFLGMILWDTAVDQGQVGITVALAVLIGVKGTFDLGAVIAATTDSKSPRIAALSELFQTDSSGTETTIRVPPDEPIDRFRPDRRAVWIRGIPRGIGKSVNPEVPIMFHGLGILVAWLLWGIPGSIAVSGGIISVFVVSTVFVEHLLHAHLEYCVYEDAVVAYDRLLDEPQWRIPTREIETVTSGSGIIERVITGTGTVRISYGNRKTERLVCLPEPDRVTELLDASIRV